VKKDWFPQCPRGNRRRGRGVELLNLPLTAAKRGGRESAVPPEDSKRKGKRGKVEPLSGSCLSRAWLE